MILTADPVHDADQYDAECERWIQSRPVCCVCGEHIQENEAYEYDEDLYCEECKWEIFNKCRVRIKEGES